MKLLVIPLAIVGIILALMLGPSIQQRWQDQNDFARQQDALQLQRQQIQLHDWQQQTEATATSRALASNAGYLFAILAIGGVLYYLNDRAARRREPLVRFYGQLVPRRLVENGALIDILAHRLEMQDIALIEDKRRPLVPTYEPSIKVLDTGASPAQIAAAPIEVIKPQADWLRWIDEQPHTLLAGRTKAGKTTLATALLAQRLRAKEPVFIIDPHSSGWLGLPTAGSASNQGELARALGAILAEYISRMQMRDQHKRATGQELAHDYWPRLTILIDESNAIADDLRLEWRTVVKQLASGSRKVGMSLLILAQSPLVEDLGISGAMRENFARVALDDRTVAQLVDGEKDKPRKDTLRAALVGVARPAAAQIGNQVWLLDRSDMAPGAAVASPNVWQGWDYQKGCRAVVRVVPLADTGNHPRNQDGNHPRNQGGSTHPDAANERITLVRQMLAQKAGFNEILRKVWAVEGKGRAYQQASDELRDILALIASAA